MSTTVFIQNSFWGAGVETAPFSPNDLANLWQWYNPNSVTQSSMAFWEDESANGNRLQTMVGTVITGSLNGLSTAQIDDLDAMQVRNTNVFDNPDQTIFVVTKPIYGTLFADYGSVANKLIIFNVDGNDGQTMRFYLRDADGDFMQRQDIPIIDTKAAFNIYGIVVDGTNQKFTVYDHTGSLYTASTASYDPTTEWSGTVEVAAYQSWGSIGLGDYNQDTGITEFAEIIIYQETKSLSEIDQLGNYLADKYNLKWNDASHDFRPSDLTNLEQWYQPGTNIKAQLATWYDCSGNGIDLTKTNGTVDMDFFNEHPVAVIDTSDAVRRSTASDTFTTANNCIFLVVKPIAGRVFNQYGSVSNKLILFAFSNGAMWAYLRDSGADIVQRNDISIPNSGSFNIYCMMANGDNQKLYVYDHTGSAYTASNGSYDGTTTWTPSYNVNARQAWGAFGDTTVHPDFGDCELAEMAIYSETKSLSEIDQIGNYLANKYTLSWTDFGGAEEG